jgi:hypothetical protein
MIYTRKEIDAGQGLFTSGEWTLIWRIAEDQYITAAKGEEPRNPDAELVAGGRLHRTPRGGVLRKITWDGE